MHDCRGSNNLKESGELIKANQLLSDIITAICAISPAFYWNPTNKTKRDEELLNYLMECSCGSFFSGFNYVMEMPLNLGTPSLRAIVTLPSKEINAKPIEILSRLKSTCAHYLDLNEWIKFILS